MSVIKKKTNFFNLNTLKVGLIVSLFAQPFEVMRTSSIMAECNIKNINFKGLWELIKLINKQEGYKGFFRGGSLAIIKNSTQYALFFAGLENFEQISTKQLSISTQPTILNVVWANTMNFCNACLSRLLSTTLISPIIVLKTRFEIVGMNEYKTIKEAIIKIKQKEGIKGFYRGILPSLIRDVPMSGIQYSLYQSMIRSYEFFTNKLAKQNSFVIGLFGASSSMVSLMAVYPFDNIRVRYQCNKGVNLGLIKTVKDIYQNEGISGFYKGYLPRLLKKAASGALIWTLYENLKGTKPTKEA